jgi:hypothetical protein
VVVRTKPRPPRALTDALGGTITYRPNIGGWSEVSCAESIQWCPGKTSAAAQTDKQAF